MRSSDGANGGSSRGGGSTTGKAMGLLIYCRHSRGGAKVRRRRWQTDLARANDSKGKPSFQVVRTPKTYRSIVSSGGQNVP